MHTPRSTLAGWGGQTGAQLLPLFNAHRVFVLGSRVVHAGETPIGMLDPSGGQDEEGLHVRLRARRLRGPPGVVYDFCAGRVGKYPHEFLKDWSGTLVVVAYSGYDATLSLDARFTAHCLAHARRKFDELVKAYASEVAKQAIQRIAWLYRARPIPRRCQLSSVYRCGGLDRCSSICTRCSVVCSPATAQGTTLYGPPTSKARW